MTFLSIAEDTIGSGSQSFRSGTKMHTLKRILLVDDDQGVREALAQALSSEHFRVVRAADGQEALERFFEGYVDLVLLDLNLPAKSGWDTLERIMAVNPYLPIIIITARPDQYELAATAGATAIMEKPLDLPLLLRLIDDLMRESPEERMRRIVCQRPIYVPAST